MNNIIWTVAVVGFIGFAIWKIMQIRLREMTAKAEFYERLGCLWKVILDNNGSYASSCVDVGIAYINSVPPKKRIYIEKKVHKLLDNSYHHYLCMLRELVKRYLAKDKAYRDESLCALFERNQRWLAYDENGCEWYGAATFEPSEKGKMSNEIRSFLLEERAACEKRLAEEAAAAAERFRKIEEERIREENARVYK